MFLVLQLKNTAVLSWGANSGLSVTVQAAVTKATSHASEMMSRLDHICFFFRMSVHCCDVLVIAIVVITIFYSPASPSLFVK